MIGFEKGFMLKSASKEKSSPQIWI